MCPIDRDVLKVGQYGLEELSDLDVLTAEARVTGSRLRTKRRCLLQRNVII